MLRRQRERTFEHLLVDLAPGALYGVTGGEGLQYVSASEAGVLDFSDSAGGAHSVAIAQLLTPGIPGDADLDETVDSSDLAVLAGNYRKTAGQLWADGDFTGDGAADISDLTVLAGNYHKSTVPPPGAEVPEPGMLGLLALGGLGIIRRRRN